MTTEEVMNVRIVKKLPSADEIIAAHPISDEGLERVKKDRREIEDILAGRDNRLIFIVGPCSAWPSEAVLEYAKRLKRLSDELAKKLKLIMRVYIQKPRTIRGWLGPVNQVDPYKEPDIAEGANYCRDMMVQVVEMGLPIADEALFTHNAKGFAVLLAWMAIGARSVEDQEHRIFASGVSCPVGMKNSTSGSIEVAVNGIVAAQHPHHAVLDGYQVETKGNPFAHLVLRGGESGTNYDAVYVNAAKDLFDKHKIKNPSILIDVSHENCRINGAKEPAQQPVVVKKVMGTMERDSEYKRLVKGFMMESFIKEGSQKLERLTAETIDRSGLSITDPCVGWDETEKILREVAADHE